MKFKQNIVPIVTVTFGFLMGLTASMLVSPVSAGTQEKLIEVIGFSPVLYERCDFNKTIVRSDVLNHVICVAK
jgi:hypothetical protein